MPQFTAHCLLSPAHCLLRTVFLGITKLDNSALEASAIRPRKYVESSKRAQDWEFGTRHSELGIGHWAIRHNLINAHCPNTPYPHAHFPEPEYICGTNLEAMKTLLLILLGSAAWNFTAAQCSVDTIPDTWNNGGQCYIDNLAVDANVITTATGFQPTGVSYQSFSSPYITLRQGEQSTFMIGFQNNGAMTVCGWIDYNNDGIYASTEIAIYEPFVNSPFVQTYVTPPISTLPDTVHMRITTQQNATTWGPGGNDACEAPGIGETEDYMVIIECTVQTIGFDPAPSICFSDSVQLNAFSNADVAWYTGSPATLQHVGPTFYLHTLPGSTDTTVYVQFATPGCFSAPMDSMMITLMPSPDANILGPDTIQSCSTVTISATPGPGDFNWNIGGNTPTIVVNSGFGGMLTLSVSAANGCYDTDGIFVQIAPDPPATYAAVVPGSWYCTNLEVYLNYDSLIAPGTCTWYTYPGNTLIGSGSQLLYNLPDTGTYQFMAIVNSVCGMDTIIRTIDGQYGTAYDSLYLVNGNLVSGTWHFCYGNDGLITAVLAGLEGTVQQWELTDLTIGFSAPWNDDDTLQIPSNMAQVGHVYTAYAIVQNAQGCYDTTETITIAPYNTMNFNLSDTAWLCSFPSAFGYGAVNYATYDLLWSTGDTTNTINVTAPMDVTVYAIDHSTGCVTYDTAYVGDASAQADLFSDTTIVCSLSATFDPAFVMYSADMWEEYDESWSLISMSNSPDYTVLNGGNNVYLVFSGYNSHGCYIHDTTNVAFDGTFTFSLGADITTTSTPVTLTGPSGYSYGYQWMPVNSGYQTIQVSTSGTYVLTVNNGYGCTYTDSIVVNILPMNVQQQASAVDVKLYPNPANEWVNVQSAETIREVRVYDVNGRVISAQTCNTLQAEIDVTKFSEGIYIVETITDSGIQRTRLVKQQ